jgi:large subunit ribosomal protein L53
MITRFMTNIEAKFNPFSESSRATRLFLALLPSNARATGLQIKTTVLPRTATASVLNVKFSMCPRTIASLPPSTRRIVQRSWAIADYLLLEDGKEMSLDGHKLGIKSLVEEVDRHSRVLQKQEALND